MEECDSPSPTSEKREEERDGLNVNMLIVSDGYDETLNINSADLSTDVNKCDEKDIETLDYEFHPP